MRIVAALSVAFVVLVGVVAVTYPNESDEVRQRNAAFMKLGDGDTPGGLKADPEQGDAGSNVIDRKTGDLLGVKGIEDWMGGGLLAMSAEDLDAVCQDLNQMSRIVEKLDAKNPVAADLRTALERTQNNLAAGIWTNGGASTLKAATDRDVITEDRPTGTDGDVNDTVFQACGVLLDNVNVGS